jgi:hypothetical protein
MSDAQAWALIGTLIGIHAHAFDREEPPAS